MVAQNTSRALAKRARVFAEALEGRVLLAYPNMQGIVYPADNPALPGAMDTYFAPDVDSQTPDANAPQIAEWLRTAGPDETLTLTGYQLSRNSGADLGKDSRFLVFGQSSSSNAKLLDGLVQRLDAEKAAVTLSASLPDNSMYLLWTQNSSGWSYPVAINRTEGWWVGPSTATRNDTVSVFGRNLSHDGGTNTSWIYIQPSSGTGQWVTPTSVDPYRVQFTVPSGLSNGSYEIWVHNGHGRQYGWSKGGTLTVDNGVTWSANQYNVQSYGAVGDGVTDDTAAIKAAITAAGTNYNTVYFPTGTYAISSYLQPKANQRWLGAGMDSSKLITRSNYDNAHEMLFGSADVFEMRSLTIEASSALTMGSMIFRGGVDKQKYFDVRFNAGAVDGLKTGKFTGTGISFSGCEFNGWNTYVEKSSQVFLDNCDFYGRSDASVLFETWQSTEVSVTGCTGQDYDNSDPNNGDGWAQGRFLYSNNIWGTARHWYLAHNTTTEMGVREAFGNQNTGEQILWEGSKTYNFEQVVSATSTTVTFNNTLVSNAATGGFMAVITRGKGLGQARMITAYDNVAKMITVESAWNVIPDTTSYIAIMRGTYQVAVYANTLDGKDRMVSSTSHIASTGVSIYGGGHDVIVDNNTMTDIRYGWLVTATRESDTLKMAPCQFNLFSNNSITDCRHGEALKADAYSDTIDPGYGNLGNVFRNGSVTNAVGGDTTNFEQNGAGFKMSSSWSGAGYAANLNVVEHANYTDVYRGLVCYIANSKTLNTVFYKNAADAATNGTDAVYFRDANQAPALNQNTYSGFTTTYASTPPGAILEMPYRVISGQSSLGAVRVPLTIRNAGTSSMSWSASDDAAWLTLSASSGSVADENSSGTIDLICDATGLGGGTYTGTVTVTAGSQTMKATVSFVVTATPAGMPTSLTALWRFDENTGTTAYDSAVSGSSANNGTIKNGAVYETGKIGKALHFDGSNDYVTVSNATDIQPTSAITVAAWVKSDTTNWNKSSCLVSKRNAYELQPISGSKTIRFQIYTGGAWAYATYTPTIDLTQWHHYAGTWNGSTITLYIDGVSVATASKSGTMADTGSMLIGKQDGAANYFDGMIDEVRIYNTAINGTDVAALAGQTELYVTGLTVTSGSSADYSVQGYALATGGTQYGDRTDTFTTIPGKYYGATYIKTADDDATSSGSSLLQFTVDRTSMVYVLHNDSYTTKPSWLSGFADTGEDVVTSHGTFSVYRAVAAAGTIGLGGNTADGLGDYGMYSVMVVPVL